MFSIDNDLEGDRGNEDGYISPENSRPRKRDLSLLSLSISSVDHLLTNLHSPHPRAAQRSHCYLRSEHSIVSTAAEPS